MLPERKRLPHDPPPWVKDGSIYFITINCVPRGQNQLCRSEVAVAIRESIIFRQQRGDWWVQLFLLMPDHLHALVSFSQASGMKSTISNWKRFAAKQMRISWQVGFFDHRIRDVHSLVEKEQYIRMNPVRQGLCNIPDEWRYCWNAEGLKG